MNKLELSKQMFNHNPVVRRGGFGVCVLRVWGVLLVTCIEDVFAQVSG